MVSLICHVHIKFKLSMKISTWVCVWNRFKHRFRTADLYGNIKEDLIKLVLSTNYIISFPMISQYTDVLIRVGKLPVAQRIKTDQYRWQNLAKLWYLYFDLD
jgi:hypothetical protein